MFKAQVEPGAAGEWFHCKVLNNLWGHFDFFFTITFITFLRKPKKKKQQQPALGDMLRHFHGLYSHRPKRSTNQRARIRAVIVKTGLFIEMVIERLSNVNK